jgi:hypothetical protein
MFAREWCPVTGRLAESLGAPGRGSPDNECGRKRGLVPPLGSQPFRGGSSCRIRGSSCSRYLTRLPDWPSGSAAQSEPVTQKPSLRGRGLPADPSPVIPSGRLCRDGEGQQVRHGERARGRPVASRQIRRPARRFQIRFMIGAQQSENHLGHDPASDLPEALASVL